MEALVYEFKGSRSSHFMYSLPSQLDDFTLVKHGKDVKPCYIDEIMKRCKMLISSESTQGL